MSLNIPTFIYKDLNESTTKTHNKVLNWYLNNLRQGEFERIMNNHSNIQRLNNLIDEADCHRRYANDSSVGIILVMIVPDLINSTKLLQDLLAKFFTQLSPADQLSSQAKSTEIIVTNLGPLKNSQSSIIMATNHTNYTQKNIDIQSETFSFGSISNYNQTIELNSVISGESGYTPSSFNETTTAIPTESTTATSTTTKYTNTDDHIDSNESSIDSFHPSCSMLPSPKYSLTRVTTIQNEGSLTHVPNTPESSTEFTPIIQVATAKSIESEEPEESEDLLNRLVITGSEQHSNMIGEVESHDVNSIYTDDDRSSTASSEYVPSMITTRTKKLNLRYKLILNNILFRDITTGEKRTAIRQIDEHEVVGDDWLLYDQDFRMDNLELLDLKDIIELMKYDQKILFYDLVLEKLGNQEQEQEQEDEIDIDDLDDVHDNDLSVVEFNGKEGASDEESIYDHETTNSIRFVQSNQTTVTPSIGLTKTITTNTKYSKIGSIKSELNLYTQDTSFSTVERSKSTPLAIKKKKKSKLQKHHNHDKTCIIV